MNHANHLGLVDKVTRSRLRGEVDCSGARVDYGLTNFVKDFLHWYYELPGGEADCAGWYGGHRDGGGGGENWDEVEVDEGNSWHRR